MTKTYDLLLINAKAVLPAEAGLKTISVDIGITERKISFIGQHGPEEKSAARQVLDLKGLHILPGIIDSQVHLRDPGLTHKEDLDTGTRAALLGGVTSVFEMPNTNPPTTSLAALEEKLSIAAKKCHTNYAFYSGASPDNISQLGQLENHPHSPGIKVFMGSSTGSLLVEDDLHLEKLLCSGKRRIAVHSEDEFRLRERKQIAIDGAHVKYHPVWRDELTALNATRRIVAIAQKTNRPLHILHVTTAEEMDFLKDKKPLITVEVLPQHLTLSAPDCYERFGTFVQMNPPIRDQRHQDRLWKAISDGTVDVVASDHAPHTLEEKQKTYPQSPSGFPGVQTLLPIMLTHVNNNKLSLERLVELLSRNPARLYSVKGKGEIKLGNDADLTIIDLTKETTIKKSWLASKCGWSPFENMQVKGWPVMALIGGEICMREEQIVKSNQGRAVDFVKN